MLKNIEEFVSEFELRFDIKTNLGNIEEILKVINKNISNEFDKIKEGKTDILASAIIKKINDNDTEDKIADINNQINKLNYKGDISDGSHTFSQLYEHRCILFAVICNQNKDIAWKSWKHDDGTMYEDYFIVGVTIEGVGDFTYHYHKDNWDLFKVKEIDKAPAWDGHTSDDITRLFSII